MGEWQKLAERLVEIDLSIEDFDSWATEPEDVAAFERLEELRDQLQEAIAQGRISRKVRRSLEDEVLLPRLSGIATDPRD